MSRFPRLTETFVLNEMIAMERQGVNVELFPLLREKAKVVQPEARPWLPRAHYHAFLSWPIVKAHWHFLRHKPGASLRLLGEVLGGTLGSLNFFFGALGIWPKAVRFAYEMQALGVEHVHAHFANHPAVAALIVHRLTGIPFSFTAHGSDLHMDRTMLRQKVEAAAFVATISNYNRELIVHDCGEAVRSKIHVVHCGMDTAVFKPSPRSAAPGQPLNILCIGTLHEVKGQTVLIDACRRLHERGLGFVCKFVGDGPDRPMLERQIAEAGLQGKVRLLGAQMREAVLKLLAEADVLVQPSVPTRSGKREGIPVVLIEALACGIPAVSSNLSGIPELVAHEQTGLLAPPRDSAALAEALAGLHADPELRRRLGQAGREKVLREFDLDDNVSALRRLMSQRGLQ